MKDILVISDNDLLLVGIERLLRQTNEFNLRKVSALDETDIIRQVQEKTCDVVIVDGFLARNGKSWLSHLLNDLASLRVLIMQIDSNQIQIYEKREIWLDPSFDLAPYL